MKYLIKILIVVIIGVATNEMGYSTVPITTIIQSVDQTKTVKMNTETEIWKDAIGYEGSYQVSNNGRVRSIDRYIRKNGTNVMTKGIILKSFKDSHNYMQVSIFSKNILVHRLIAKAFIQNNNNYPAVNHIDGNKSNNNLENLEWCTNSENMLHAFRLGLKKPQNLGKFGYENHLSKSVSQFEKSGIFISTYGSIKEAKRETGIDNTRIGKCANGKRKYAGGFIWKYAS